MMTAFGISWDTFEADSELNALSKAWTSLFILLECGTLEFVNRIYLKRYRRTFLNSRHRGSCSRIRSRECAIDGKSQN